jgi:hypothetical protein
MLTFFLVLRNRASLLDGYEAHSAGRENDAASAPFQGLMNDKIKKPIVMRLRLQLQKLCGFLRHRLRLVNKQVSDLIKLYPKSRIHRSKKENVLLLSFSIYVNSLQNNTNSENKKRESQMLELNRFLKCNKNKPLYFR